MEEFIESLTPDGSQESGPGNVEQLAEAYREQQKKGKQAAAKTKKHIQKNQKKAALLSFILKILKDESIISLFYNLYKSGVDIESLWKALYPLIRQDTPDELIPFLYPNNDDLTITSYLELVKNHITLSSSSKKYLPKWYEYLYSLIISYDLGGVRGLSEEDLEKLKNAIPEYC